jgi:hypothetical protein
MDYRRSPVYDECSDGYSSRDLVDRVIGFVQSVDYNNPNESKIIINSRK